jgi:hypothetical protein
LDQEWIGNGSMLLQSIACHVTLNQPAPMLAGNQSCHPTIESWHTIAGNVALDIIGQNRT